MIETLKTLIQSRLQTLTLIRAVAPMVLVLLAGLVYHEFVWDAILGNLVLNTLIVLVGIGGGALIVFRLVELQREHRALLRFGEETRGGAAMDQLLEEPWLESCMVQRYLHNIAQTKGKLSSQLDQDAIENELHALGGDFESKLETPNFLVGFMIAMGLLGTFIGLLETLTGISGMLDGLAGGSGTESIEQEFLKLVGELRRPLAGMGIAFSASMFGLVGSLMLGMAVLTVRRYIRKVIAAARTTLHDLTERTRGPVAQVGAGPAVVSRGGGVSEAFLSDFMAELTGNISELQELFHRSQDASLQLTARVDGMAQHLEMLSQAIENNVAAAKKTNDLLGFGPRMKETNEQMLTELRAIQQSSADQQKISARLVDVLSGIDQKLGTGNDTQRMYQEGHSNLTRETLNKLDEAVNILHSVNDRASDSESKMDRKLQGLATTTTNMANSLQGMAAKLSEIAMSGQNRLQSANTVQQILRDSNVDVLGAFKELGERVKKVEDADIGANRHLFEIKENIAAMNASLEALDLVAKGVSRQGSLLEATLEEMRTGQKNLSRDLQKQLREVARDAAREAARDAVAETVIQA